MDLFSYVVRYDIGFAPNPFHGWCSLATCHEDFRGRVTVGDWVVGTGSAGKGLDGRLVYAMRVDEVVTFDDYWHDERFAAKRPVRRGSMRQRYGDNIYYRDEDANWVQADSRHSQVDGTPNAAHIAKDTKADAVLLARDYVYYGRSALDIPARLRSWPGPAWTGTRFNPHQEADYDLCMTYSGFRRHFPDDFKDAVVDWLRDLIAQGEVPNRGDPADW
ncbi:MAG: hypothetical protein WD942_00095 [Dehalococcoidia bacterium]